MGLRTTIAAQVSGSLLDTTGNVLTVKRAFANIAASTTGGQVVALVTGKKIRVLALSALAGSTATGVTFNSGTVGQAGTAISPLLANGANGGEVLPYNPHGWFETAAGEALTATTGTGSATGVLVTYVEVS